MLNFLNALIHLGDLLTNEYAVAEAHRNLSVKYPEGIAVLSEVKNRCTIVLAMVTNLDVDLPEKDLPILGGAVAGHATHLLTGDARDFGKFWDKTVYGVKVVSPRMLILETGLS